MICGKLIYTLYISMCQALIKGISGGQRKRTSVGVEIITDPDVRNLSLSDVVYSIFTLEINIKDE